VNLSVKKLRRGATVFGGTFLGLGLVAAMAGPALACDVKITGTPSCVTDDGWTATWKVQNDWREDATITSVKLDGNEVSIGDLHQGTVIKPDYAETVTGVSNFPKADTYHRVDVSLHWGNSDSTLDDTSSADVKPQTEGCKPTSTPSSSAPAPSDSTPPSSSSPAPTDTPTIPIPSESAPAVPGTIYKADCSSETIGLDNTKTPIEYVLTFKPKTGASQTLDIKPGEKKSAKFAVSGDSFYVKMTVVAKYKGKTSPPDTATIPWEKPASCSSGALAVTGSSTGPLAGGAIAVLLLGGGAFFLARRRKIRFAA
jgi:uncharacterized protein (TIGR04145 family)